MDENDRGSDRDEDAPSGRTGRAKKRLNAVVSGTDQEIKGKLSDAVTVAGETSSNLRTQFQTLRSQTAEVARPVLLSVREHIRDNDIDVTISGNTIHVEGDDDGLKNIDADLREAFKDRDVHVEYDREGGLSIEIEERN